MGTVTRLPPREEWATPVQVWEFISAEIIELSRVKTQQQIADFLRIVQITSQLPLAMWYWYLQILTLQSDAWRTFLDQQTHTVRKIIKD